MLHRIAKFAACGLVLAPIGARGATPPRAAHIVGASKAAQAAHAKPTRVEFLRDVAPILDRGGCSIADCHGKFGGRGGFQLSLLTLSPEDDYVPIVQGARGRRVNFAAPEKSLILLKATGSIPHTGGMRFDVGSPQYNTFLRWIRQGAPFDDKDPRLVSVALRPGQVSLHRVGQKLQLRAIARYTDGSVRDVTSQAVFSSSNPSVLQVSEDGVVTGVRWGGGAILARYLGTIAPSFFTLPQARKGPYPKTPENNVIDRLVFDNLKRLNVLPSSLCNDYEFLRRVTLDTLGRLPSPEEIDAFKSDQAPDKRARTIAALLERPEFVDYRTMRLADLMRVNPRKLGVLGDRPAALFYEWIWNSVSSDKHWDQFVREVVTARGSTYQYGPANFYRIETAPNDRMENISQAFLGVRMMCARCHKHPFDRWNTDNYWNFAAFCGKVGLRRGRLYDENVVYYSPDARVLNQSVTGKNKGKTAPPTFLGEKDPAPAQSDDVKALADWITSDNNPFFARATVNRLWSYYFARGIISPVDDMRATTPSSVPGLLEALADELIRSKYDVKRVISLILNSRVYQLSALAVPSNVNDDRYFSHYMPRPMPAEALLDMINQAAGAREQFSTFPERARAVQASLPPSNVFLDSFGQSHREFLADIDPKLEPNLVQTLHMINSPYIDGKVRSGRTVGEVLKSSQSDDDIVRGLYMRTVCRPPTAGEITKAEGLMRKAANRSEGAQDLLWALLTSREFYFNH